MTVNEMTDYFQHDLIATEVKGAQATIECLPPTRYTSVLVSSRHNQLVETMTTEPDAPVALKLFARSRNEGARSAAVQASLNIPQNRCCVLSESQQICQSRMQRGIVIKLGPCHMHFTHAASQPTTLPTCRFVQDGPYPLTDLLKPRSMSSH